MRITPLDIRKQEFKKSMRGFDPDEVYAFLNTVAEEYEIALSDNKGLREHIVNLKERLAEFKGMETNLRNTLLTAEKLTADAKENAKREAELILREAEVEAERASENIRSHARRLRREILELKKQKDNYITRLRTLIDSHREMTVGFEDDFVGADQEIENMESRTRDNSGNTTQHRRMSRERITEKFSRKLKEETDAGDAGVQEMKSLSSHTERGAEAAPKPPRAVREESQYLQQDLSEEDLARSSAETASDMIGVPIGKVNVDVEIGETSTENLSYDELRESVDEDIEHSIYPDIDEDDEKRIPREQNAPSGSSLAKGDDSVSANPGGSVDVDEDSKDKDEWTSYEVEKKKTDWRDYEISPTDTLDENEVEEALSGLTEGLEHLGGENPESEEQAQRSPHERVPESKEVYSGEERPESDFQDQKQPENPGTKSENQDGGIENNSEQPEDSPDSAEEAKEKNVWSMDRMRKNLTNMGGQDS
ncbi:DivIVA domain-containing protein [bacterium]|nr:DivIVA domain-containing protein [bacterium]